jgi:transposase
MWLLSKLIPDFRCIADFRKDNSKAIKLVFREFVRLYGKLDLLSKEQIVIDGSKFKAVNSKKLNFSAGKLNDRIQKIDEKLEQYLAYLDQNDKKEKELGEYTKEELEQLIKELNERKATYNSYLQELTQTDTKISDTSRSKVNAFQWENGCLL